MAFGSSMEGIFLQPLLLFSAERQAALFVVVGNTKKLYR